MEAKETVDVTETHVDEKALAETPDPGAVEPAREVARPIPQAACCGNGYGNDGNFIYAMGTIEPRFPSLGVEKEFLQLVKEGKTVNLTDRQLLHEILSQPENHYLARELCFVLTVENLDTYILIPSTRQEMVQLIEAIKPKQGTDCDVVIGTRGPLAPPEMCNGLQVPQVYCDRIYSFEVEEFINAIPQPKGMEKSVFKNAARELFDRIKQLVDNAGGIDENRALNYVALRYPNIYSLALEMFAADKSLSMVEVQPSRLSGARKIVNIIFSYINRNTDVVEKYFTRIDVSGKWPFLVTKLQPYIER